MKAVNDTWRQLVSRRLLPVVILLAAALIAVPLVLAQDPEPAEPAALAPVDDSAGAATKTIVSVATPEGRKRKVLGSRTNPFRGAPLPKAETSTTTQSSSSDTAGGSSTSVPDLGESAASSGGGSTPSAGTAPSAGTTPTVGTTPATRAPAPKHYAKDELTVRFGADSPERRSLELLEPLPSDENPVLIYVGVRDDGKTAVFLVDHGVNAIGDGSCHPSPEECETLRLREGETEFFDVTDGSGKVTAQYELDLLEIHNGATASTAGKRALKTS